MIAFVLCSVLVGLVAGTVALLTGASFLMALIIYSAFGFLTISAVLIRALICQQLKAARVGLAHSS